MPPTIDVFAADSASSRKGGLPIAIGVPFAPGQLREPIELTVTPPSGAVQSAAGRALVNWPDGSVRWCLISFGAAERGAYSVNPGRSAPPENPVRLMRQADTTMLSNGLVDVELSTAGPGPIHRITAGGHTYIDKPGDLRFVVDTADTTREPARTLRVIEESPWRARLRLEGGHHDPAGRRKFNYRLDIELWANQPTLRLDYHFFNLERGRDNIDVDRMAAEFDFNLGRRTQRHFLQNAHTLLHVPREVQNPAPVAIVADQARGSSHVEHENMLLDSEEYNFHVRPPLIDTQDWLGVGDDHRSVYIRMQDFAAMRPKRIASKGSSVELEFWPRSAGRMEMPQGRSRRQVITLTFADQPKLSPTEIVQRLDGPLWEGRACVSPAWLAERGEFDQDRVFVRASHIRMEKFLGRLVGLDTPETWFDLGDTADAGYVSTYIPIGNAQELKPGAPAMERVYLASPHHAFMGSTEFYEPVWTNNEYDAIHALATEVMRTGDNGHWRLLRWFARHNIEVDFIHYSDHKQQHRATPQHSARHNRSGAILSHFWTQGLLEYYCLTGDVDALEVAKALGDKIIEDLADPEMRRSFWGFTRELGWPTISLSQLADITGEERYRVQCREIVDFFVGYDRKEFSGALKLSSGDPRYSLERQMISGFFAYASMVEGVDHYIRKTGDEKARQWLIELLQDLRQALDDTHKAGQPTSLLAMLPHGMAIGYELTGDERFLRSGMICLEEGLMEDKIVHTTKPVAMMHRAVVRFLFHANKKGLLESLELLHARQL